MAVGIRAGYSMSVLRTIHDMHEILWLYTTRHVSDSW
jgi:hypothetical protein